MDLAARATSEACLGGKRALSARARVLFTLEVLDVTRVFPFFPRAGR